MILILSFFHFFQMRADGTAAREKVGYVLRDLLADKYSSSSKSKAARRKSQQSQGGTSSKNKKSSSSNETKPRNS